MVSFSGLFPLANAIENSICFQELEKIFKPSNKGYDDVGKFKTLIYLLYCGGESLSDIKRLDSDEGLKQMLGVKCFPKANTFSNFLNGKIKQEVEKIEAFNFRQTIKFYQRKRIKKVTLDIDSSLIKNKKYQSKYTYKRFKGYNPIYILDEKNQQVILGKMRNGNASPQADILDMLSEVLVEFKKHNIAVRVRIDSAGYQKEIIDYLSLENIPFTITGDNFKGKLSLFKEIPEERWKACGENTQSTIIIDSITSKGNITPIKLIVKRKEKEQYDLIEGRYKYYYIVTNIETEDAMSIIHFHQQRANSENIFKDLKGNYLLDKLPCDEIEANAVFMQILILAYNCFQWIKRSFFEKHWHSFTLKTIRFKLIALAGKITKQGRQTRLLINEKYQFFEELKICFVMSKYCIF